MPDFEEERRQMVERYRRSGYIVTDKIVQAMLKVPRELFMDDNYVNSAYQDQPFPIPGDGLQTISAPYMYPICYEQLEIEQGDSFLEVGAGSGYGAALAYELVGSTGQVIAVEINPNTFHFAKSNLESAGYRDIILVNDDGYRGYPEEAPFDAICITAACPEIPPPLIEQLNSPGRLVAPVGGTSIFGQDLILLEKDEKGFIKRKSLMKVAYVPMTREHRR
ncbi:MAG: protein-L-isoaspartate O-methyltransferase [Candidatus Bathyarchaeia archaeon]